MEIMDFSVDSNPMTSAMTGKMWLKFTKYWNDICLLLVVVVMLDLRYKIHLIEYYATRLGMTKSDLVGDSVKKIICELVFAYQTESSTSQVGFSSSFTASTTDLDFELFMIQRKRSRTTLVITELDHY
ncbi:Zinc finger BED domain-containing protein RICESLEEPER 3 [Linum perenne]